MLPLFSTTAANFAEQLSKRLDRLSADDTKLRATVGTIIEDVRSRGDAALLEYTKQFDHVGAMEIDKLHIGAAAIHNALLSIDNATREHLEFAADNIRRYHQQQVRADWHYTDALGNTLGQRITPIDAVGIYAPGGTACYPSSVLMNAIPAKLAGVDRIVLVSPTPNDVVNPILLAAAAVAGIDEMWRIGGAQAIAALAYGTNSIQAIDKITGPGNQYVSEAKRQVFGKVGIDMIAGPSELLIISDEHIDPVTVAADLCAQAEHDTNAQSILLSTSPTHCQAVIHAIENLLKLQSFGNRDKIIRTSLQNRGAAISCKHIDEVIELANYIAPEHLQIMVNNSNEILPKIKHAGAIFIGNSCEVLGDYCAGSNHVLPTNGSARFFSGLSVDDFTKKTAIIDCSLSGAATLAYTAHKLAQLEGLPAHAFAAAQRMSP